MKAEAIKVLFLTANPDSMARLRTDREFQAIQDAIRSAELSGGFEIVRRMALQVGDLQEEMLQHQPDIVHFSGHGTAAGEIVLEEPEGTPRRVDKKALADMFRLLNGRVRVVVLNACFSRPMADAIAEHVPCAIGMVDSIKDRAAVEFSVAFYRALGYGKSVREAFAWGRNALSLLGHPDAQVPELVTRSGIDPDKVVLVERVSQDSIVTPGENVVLFLDLASENAITTSEVETRLSGGRPTRIFRATDFGAAPSPRGADFASSADAIQRMVAKARDAREPNALKPYFYVVGRATLPVFAHLGMELSAWADVTLLSKRKGEHWDVLSLGDTATKGVERFFEPSPELQAARPSISNGRVAVFISTNHPPNVEAINKLFDERGETPAGIIEVRTTPGSETLLDGTNAAQAMEELIQVFNRIRDVYPRTTKLALFVAGPATLAFMAARAVNRNIFDDVWVPNYEGGVYRRAAELPWKGRRRPEVSVAPDAEHERARILRVLCACVRDLQQKLRREHLPPEPIVTNQEAGRALVRVKGIVVADEPQGEVFDLRVSEMKMSFGTRLLDAFRSMPEKDWKSAGQLLVLHEVLHVDQNLQFPLHQGTGRAGFALEEVDFWADALAVGTLASFQISRGGEAAEEQLREIVVAYVDAVLSGIEAFDRFEHGKRIDELSERRLRRYLVWHLQRVRAATLRSVDDLWQLFGRRLLVEMAPLKGRLDERSDKLVDSALPETEIFVVLQGRMMRIPSKPQNGIAPAAIVDAVRTYNRSVLERAMGFVRESHRQILTPWVP